jgi:hypothetical protein
VPPQALPRPRTPLHRAKRALLPTLIGHDLGSELEQISKALPTDADGSPVDLVPFNESAQLCASRLLKLVDEDKKKTASETAPSSSA